MAKRALKENEQTGKKKHDSAFLSPLTLFQGSPHNDTFVKTCYAEIDATPDTNSSDGYTFIHRDFGLMKTGEATKNIADEHNLVADEQIAMHALPL